MHSGIRALENHEKMRVAVEPSAAAGVFSSAEDGIYPPNATGFNLQMAKHNAVANVTHAR
jgi:hypothetical protein